MMKRLGLNNKGLTITELLVCFLIVTVISTSLFTTISSFNNRRNVESVKAKLLSYKSTISKDIQNDIIDKGLINATVVEKAEPDYYYAITLTFKDGSVKKIGVRDKSGEGYGSGDTAETAIECNGDPVDDDFYITYGKDLPSDFNNPTQGGGSYILYKLPDVGFSTNDCSEKTYDLRFAHVSVEATDDVFSLFINFEHPDLAYGYSLDIVTPVNFSFQSNHVRELPDIPSDVCVVGSPENFSTDCWGTIVKAAQENNLSKYHVGDEKEVDMGSLGTHTIRIANMSTPSVCSGSGFSQSACGFVLEFKDIITSHIMSNNSTSAGGWPVTEMRRYVNDEIFNSLPDELKSGIIDTFTVSGYGSNDSNVFTASDKIYLLGEGEVILNGENGGATSPLDNSVSYTRQLDYYANNNVVKNNWAGAIKNGSWALRSPNRVSDAAFAVIVSSTGDCWSLYPPTSTAGVSPAFRLG